MKKKSTIQVKLTAVCTAALLGFSGCSMEDMADRVARKIKERQDMLYEGEKQASAEKRKGFISENDSSEGDLESSVEWHDAVLSQGIADYLEKEVSEITYEDLTEIREFSFDMSCDGTIYSVEDLKYLTNLEMLEISNDSMYFTVDTSDFSAIGELKKLKYLSIEEVLVEDPSFVANLTELTELYLIECGLKEISFIEGLPFLENVSFYGNYLIDISPLAGHPYLEVISLAHNEYLTDISPLSELPALHEAGLHYCMISDISPLYELHNLELLNLSGNTYLDLSGLSNLPKLKVLGLNECQLADISGLSGLTELVQLQLANNQLQDISALSGMTKLTRLNLEANFISDFTPLQNMNKLFRLEMYYNPMEKVPDNLLGIPYLNITSYYSWQTEKGKKQAEQERSLANELMAGYLEEQIGSKYAADVVTGYLNEDSYEDMVIMVDDADSYLHEFYVFLGDKNGNYEPAGRVDFHDDQYVSMEEDAFYGMKIVNRNLILSYRYQEDYGWLDTYYFRYHKGEGTLARITIVNYYTGSTGADYCDYDFINQKSSYSVYVMQDNAMENGMEKFLLQNSGSDTVYKGDTNYYPGLDSQYDFYCFQSRLENADVGFEAVLQEKFTEYEKKPLAYTEETRENYSKLSGINVPEYYYEADGGILYFSNLIANEQYEVFMIFAYLKDGEKSYYLYNVDTKEVVTKNGTQYNEEYDDERKAGA